MKILQIVPRLPGAREGVGDYALGLARRLEEEHDLASTFVAGNEGRDALSGALEREASQNYFAVILHYVSYGYDPRGVPRWLPDLLRRLPVSNRLLTIFHELYASGTWRQSAFWLRPVQKQIARSIAELSACAIVSSPVAQEQLALLAGGTRIIVHPVFSNFGEPDDRSGALPPRDLQRWIICGGTELIARSLGSFSKVMKWIPQPFSPRELVVMGGPEDARLRRQLESLPLARTSYHPEIEAGQASAILAAGAFGWIDYFARPDVPMPAVLKSTAFAAFCAHGVIPVFPHSGDPISLLGDRLPGPFQVAPSGQNLPAPADVAAVAASIHHWYQRHASSKHLAAAVAAALQKSPNE